MPAKENLTTTTDITVKAREVDFVTMFGENWNSLREILNIMRPIRKTPGTTLTSYKATIELEDGSIGEGVEIPYSQAKVEPVRYSDLTLKKWAKAVSIEAVNEYGATVALIICLGTAITHIAPSKVSFLSSAKPSGVFIYTP